MTEVFDQDAVPRTQTRSVPPPVPSGWQPIGDEDLDRIFDELLDGAVLRPYLPVADPDPKDFATSAEHTAAFLEQKNHEYRMEQLWRNIRGAIYLIKCGVSGAGVDQYLAANRARGASALRHGLWRFDAWTQRHFWDGFLVLSSLLTVVGFGVVAAHAEVTEISAWGFGASLLGIAGVTVEVIRRGD